MKKRLTLLLAAAALCGVVSAQKLSKADVVKTLPSATKIFKSPAKAYGQRDFTYFSGSSISMLGIRKVETYDAAIYIPSTFAGKKITEIGFLLVDKSVLKNVSCWVNTTLPSNVTRSTYYNAFATSDLYNYNENYTQVALGDDKAVTVPADGCYVGYTFTPTSITSNAGQYPLVTTSGQNDVEGGMFLRTSSTLTNWADCYGQGYGNLSIVVVLTGEYGENIVIVPASFGKVNVLKGGDAKTASVTLTNGGANEVNSVAYTIEDVKSGNVSEEQTLTLAEAIASFGSSTVSLPFNPDAEIGLAEKKVTITKVNGVANNAGEGMNTVIDGYVRTLTQAAPHKVVEEELTATGCGWCPRGIVGMQQCSKKISDKWIGIAVHGSVNYSDPMQITAYNFMLSGASLPSAYVNRLALIDPFYGSGEESMGIIDDVNAIADILPEASVKASAEWNADSTKVNVNTDVTFYTNYDEAPYGVAYVLVADSLHGTAKGWTQTNYFANASQFKNDPYLKDWTLAGSSVKGEDMWYNHVAIAAQNVESGAKGSIVAPIVADATQNHTTSFDLTNGIKSYNGTQLVQNKKQLKVVAMLINQSTGEIVNADEVAILGGTSGIADVATKGGNAVEVARYTLNGVKLTAPQKGINIVKMSDGRTVKEMVK